MKQQTMQEGILIGSQTTLMIGFSDDEQSCQSLMDNSNILSKEV